MFQERTYKTGHGRTKVQGAIENTGKSDMSEGGDGAGIIAKIEELRIERGWSQAQLSERAGLGKGAVNDLANNPDRKPRPQTLAAIAAALGVDVDFLEGRARAGGPLAPDQVEAAVMGGGGLGALRSGGIVAYDIPPGGAFRARREIAMVDPAGDQRSGDAVLVDTDLGLQVRHLAEPYVVTRGAAGELRHLLRGAGCNVLGRVVSRVSIF